MQLANGATAHFMCAGTRGMFVLASWPKEAGPGCPGVEYIVWRVAPGGATEDGHYTRHMRDAMAVLMERTGDNAFPVPLHATPSDGLRAPCVKRTEVDADGALWLSVLAPGGRPLSIEVSDKMVTVARPGAGRHEATFIGSVDL